MLVALGCSVPVPFWSTFEASPESVTSASSAGAATSGGAGMSPSPARVKPVQITSTRRAFRLFYAGRVRAVDADFRTYDFDNWCDLPPGADHETIVTPRRRIRIPRVIQLLHYDRVPRREVRFTRRNIFFRDRNRCQYCGHVFPQAELNLDHVVPLSRGGTSSWENVVCACIPCNSRKGNRTPHEAHMELMYLPYVLSLHEDMILRGRRILADQMEFLLASVPRSSRLHG